MKTHWVNGGGGVKLHVIETGNQRGRPILFIHGASQCWLQWSLQMNSSLAEAHRLVALDMRGHGLSDKPHDAYGDSKLWADDVNAVIETLNLDRPVLSGWSYGPLVFLDYIRHYGEDRLGGLQLVGAVTKLGSEQAMAVLTPDFLASSHNSFQATQKPVSAAWRGCCDCVSPASPRPPNAFLCWDTMSRSRRMSVKGCSRGPSITTTFYPRSASRC